MKPELLLLAGWLSIAALGAQTTAPAVDEILARVQTNTGQFEAALPDFVCDEKIDSFVTAQGEMLREVVAESHFTGLQKRSGRLAFTETREYVTIDGKPAAKGQTPRKVLLFAGGFSSLLDQTFSAIFARFHDYRILGAETFGGRPALSIEFSTRPGQKAMSISWDEKAMIQRDTGKAWIDAETLQVLRIERRFLNIPPEYSGIVATVDYGPVSIDGRPFWMPLRVNLDQSLKDSGRRIYKAEYRNYRKFEVASGIVYQPGP